MIDAAVLTGDLIGSQKAGQASTESAMNAIAQTAQALGAPFARYRGDGWQVLLARPELALRFALLVTARLRSINAPLSRFSVGIDGIAPERAASLAAESGAAFILSGQMLDDMPKRSVFMIASTNKDLSEMTCAAARLADQVARKWTRPQAEAMTLALQSSEPSGATVARTLGISPAAASYRLQGANWWDIKAVVSAFERELGQSHG